MRTLLLFRGAPGCGKSTYIEQNGLKPYTLSADDIRCMCQSQILTPEGTEGINQSHNSQAWKMLYQLLETRMKLGEFTVVDATNSKTCEMQRYKDMAKNYRYRVFCIDMTSVPIEEVKRRNKQRPVYKVVPDEVIDNMYARFATQQIPSSVTVLRPDELDRIWIKPLDFSHFKKIHHIGDIHGCCSVLKDYIESNGNLKEEEMYIFLGDYIDRGIENAETLKFLCEIANKPNVLMLEGNHEIHLWRWACGAKSNSREFESVTKLELERRRVSKKDVRQLYRKLAQCCYYSYNGKTVLATHGGISYIPNNRNLLTVSTDQMIRGVGKYGDVLEVDNTFDLKMNDGAHSNQYYQIHGHRNTSKANVQANKSCFNLEGAVEFGGELRCLQLSEGGVTTVEIPNTVCKGEIVNATEEKSVNKDFSINEWVNELRSNHYIKEKKFGNISSFNFTKNAFYDKHWDEQTSKARGLYVNTNTSQIVARAYEKFFNINERPETQFDMLQHKLVFPATAYKKENGFLGIVGYDEESDELIITSKSDIQGDFAQYFKEILFSKVADIEKMKNYVRTNKVSLAFECVDILRDPHIIEYVESNVYLLDVVKNQMAFEKIDYDDVLHVAIQLGVECKEKVVEFSNWNEFYDWYHEVNEADYQYEGRYIEGFVIEDSAGFMTKIKLDYYNFWKFMRSVAHESIRNGHIKKTSALTTPLSNHFYGWVKQLHTSKDDKNFPRDIIALRKMFYKEINIEQ